MNKNLKKILALIISVHFLIPILTGASAQENIQENIVQTAQIPKVIEMEAGFLDALRMLPENVDFDSYVTREEAAVLICKMLARDDLAESYTNVSYYEDVSVYSPNIGYINVVTNEGLFSGRSERIFAPKDEITYAEMAKLLVTSVGYAIAADKKGGYPDGYLSVAASLKILSNVGYGGTAPVKWGDAVKMVYETMNVDVLSNDTYTSGNLVTIEKQEGSTLLSLNHKLSCDEGQITATPRAKLYGMGPSDELDIGEIEIDGNLYVYNTEKLTYLDGLTGYNVEYFYREDSLGRNEVVYVYLKNNETITVMSYDIVEVYGFDIGENGSAYLKYKDEDTMKKAENLPLDSSLSLIVNDNTVPYITDADLFPECGQVTLIDSNHDNKYDVAIVLSYDMQIVDVVSIYDKHIFFKDTTENPLASTVPLVLNPTYKDVYYEVICEGEEISLNKLREDDVVGIIESEKDDFVYYRIELLSSGMEGVIESYGDDEVTVDGVTYMVASTYDFNANGIQLGERYKLYFDFADRLFRTEIIDERIDFEYVLIAAGLDGKGINKKAQIKVCYSPHTRGKQIHIYDLAENVKINGKRCKANAAIEELKLKSADAAKVNSEFLQPLRYVEFNDAGEVKMIETVTAGTTSTKESRTYVGTGPYHEAFGDIPISYETHMFYIPETMLDEDWYFTEYNKIKFGKNYTTLMWGEKVDVDGTTILPECVFVYHDRTNTDPSFNIDYTLPMLISDITMVLDKSSGDYLPRIETYNSGGKFTYPADSRNPNKSCFDDIKVGDIVFPALTDLGESSTAKVQKVPGGNMWSCDKLISLSDETLYYQNMTDNFYGRVETIRTNPRLNKCVVSAYVGETELRSVSLTGVPIYYYDRGENVVNLATYAAIKPADVYGKQDASRIFVFFDETVLDDNDQFKAIMAVIVGEK